MATSASSPQLSPRLQVRPDTAVVAALALVLTVITWYPLAWWLGALWAKWMEFGAAGLLANASREGSLAPGTDAVRWACVAGLGVLSMTGWAVARRRLAVWVAATAALSYGLALVLVWFDPGYVFSDVVD